IKSIDTSAPRACGRADTTKASMLNAKRIFFIVLSNVYEAFDFSAPGFIQLLIRKANLPRACSTAEGPRMTPMSRIPRLTVGRLIRLHQGSHPSGFPSNLARPRCELCVRHRPSELGCFESGKQEAGK